MTSTTACPTCGDSLHPGARFCAKCGSDATGGKAVSEADALFGPASLQERLFDLVRDATAGEYDVAAELGRGGMATVYLAHDLALDRKVAIKVMAPHLLYGDGSVERFKREARTAGQLSHPHIIPIHAVRQTDQLLFFVMKFVDGRGLDSVIAELGQLPIKMVSAIVTQVGSALSYAHKKGVVHRDIKPANIMLDEDGWAVVTDFGIAKVAEAKGLTQTGAAVGTPYYMSPEQCSGKEVTGASDQYSLGIVTYEMLTGRTPFRGVSVMEIMKAHFFDQPAPIESLRPDCPPELAATVMRMLEKEAVDRWPSLEEVVARVGAVPLAHDDPVRTQMVELARSGQRQRPRLSVPVSPSPLTRPRATARRSTAASPKESSGAAVALIGIALSLAAIGGWAFISNQGTRNGGEALQVPDVAIRAPAAPSEDGIKGRPAPAEFDSVAAALGRMTDTGASKVDQTLPPVPAPVESIKVPPPAKTQRRDSARTRPSPPTVGRPTVGKPSVTQLKMSEPLPHDTLTLPVVLQQPAVREPEPAPVRIDPPKPATGVIRIGSKTVEAFLSINGGPPQRLSKVRSITVPAGIVHLRVSANNCDVEGQDKNVSPGDTVLVGLINLKNCIN